MDNKYIFKQIVKRTAYRRTPLDSIVWAFAIVCTMMGAWCVQPTKHFHEPSGMSNFWEMPKKSKWTVVGGPKYTPCSTCGRTGHVRYYPANSEAFRMLCNVASSELGQPYVGWVTGNEFKYLMQIARQENSGGDPRLVNYIGCKGLWQINQRAHKIRVPDCPLWQTKWALVYIRQRHDTPYKARRHQRANDSY